MTAALAAPLALCAETLPGSVHKQIQAAEAECRAQGGELKAQDIAYHWRLPQSGFDAYVLDWSLARCKGSTPLFAAPSGNRLDIHVRTRQGVWEPKLRRSVLDFTLKRSEASATPRMLIWVRGGKSGEKVIGQELVWRRGKFHVSEMARDRPGSR